MAEPLPVRLKAWQGQRSNKEAANLLGISLATYRKYLYGTRTPNALAMAELDRRIAECPTAK